MCGHILPASVFVVPDRPSVRGTGAMVVSRPTAPTMRGMHHDGCRGANRCRCHDHGWWTDRHRTCDNNRGRAWRRHHHDGRWTWRPETDAEGNAGIGPGDKHHACGDHRKPCEEFGFHGFHNCAFGRSGWMKPFRRPSSKKTMPSSAQSMKESSRGASIPLNRDTGTVIQAAPTGMAALVCGRPAGQTGPQAGLHPACGTRSAYE